MIRARSGKSACRLLLGAGAMALMIPAVAGCEAGNSAPTLEYHPAAAGSLTTINGIQVSNAFVLGAPSGSTLPKGSSASMFVALYNNNENSDKLLGITAQGAGSVTLSGGSVTLPSDQSVNLTGPQPKVVLKDLSAPLSSGGTIQVIFDFQHAGEVPLTVPVEAQSYYWSTYSPAPSASASSTASPGASSSTSPSAGASSTPTTSASGTPSPSAS